MLYVPKLSPMLYDVSSDTVVSPVTLHITCRRKAALSEYLLLCNRSPYSLPRMHQRSWSPSEGNMSASAVQDNFLLKSRPHAIQLYGDLKENCQPEVQSYRGD